MRPGIFFLFSLLTAGLLSGQSNPSWWKYVPPDSTALVGLRWETLQMSFLAGAVEMEMAPDGALHFPELPILKNANQFVIGGPSLVAAAQGRFPLTQLRTQAAALGFEKTRFQNAELWISQDQATSSVAYISERLLLIGPADAVRESLARVADPKDRSYSPLMARGARYIEEDLWVVAAKLPDPLGSLFLPLDLDARSFEGSVSEWEGLHLVASIERPTPTDAVEFADFLSAALDERPAMAEGTEITTRDRSVMIRMDLDEEQLRSSLRLPQPPAPVQPATAQPGAISMAAPQSAPKVIPASLAAPVAPKSEGKPSQPAPKSPVKSPLPVLVAAVNVPSTAARELPPLPAATPSALPAAPKPAPKELKEFRPPTVAGLRTSSVQVAQRNPAETGVVRFPAVAATMVAVPALPLSVSLPPAPPKKVRIVGLEDGPREILMPGASR